jgi:hypothetical protein
MSLGILNKILLIMFFMSCLTITRHGYYFIQALLTSTEEQPIKYRVSNIALILLGVSISYVLTVLFTGITL